MNHNQIETARWESLPRIRYRGQPVGLGIPLAFAGGGLCVNMILAYTPEEHWILQVCTIAMAIGFGFMCLLGVNYLLMPLEKLWLSREEVQLRLGPLVLRRIRAADIRSLGGTSKEVTIKKRDCTLNRILIYCNGKWPKNRTLWLDWSLDAEDTLREYLPDANFLM